MSRYYAGIGSRRTPNSILSIMEGVAKMLVAKGFGLRSGGAEGADTAFERGAGSKKEIFRPKHANAAAMKIASEHHPAWFNCNDYVRKLHGRNAQIILGEDLSYPVEFVICWTPKGNEVGGTALGIRIAKSHNIPVFNLAVEGSLTKLKEYLNGNVG